MGVMKVKNSAGDWVDVAEATAITNQGSIQFDTIHKTGDRTYDLSKYANCGRYFLFYSIGNASKHMLCYDSGNTTGYLYVLNLEDGMEVINGIKTFVTDAYAPSYDYDSIFHAYNDTAGTFVGKTGIVKCGTVVDGIYTHPYTKNYVGQYAVVMYVG